MDINEAIENGIIKRAKKPALIGLHPGITGEVSPFLTGNLTGITGNLNGIRGNLNGITGDLTGITGDLSDIRGDLKPEAESAAQK